MDGGCLITHYLTGHGGWSSGEAGEPVWHWCRCLDACKPASQAGRMPSNNRRMISSPKNSMRSAAIRRFNFNAAESLRPQRNPASRMVPPLTNTKIAMRWRGGCEARNNSQSRLRPASIAGSASCAFWSNGEMMS